VWWHRRDGQAKVAGIVICCAGAILMTFYKGPVVLGAKPTSTLEAASTSMIKEPVHLPGSGIPHTTIDGWQIGVLCLIGNCLCMGTNINLQVCLCLPLLACSQYCIYDWIVLESMPIPASTVIVPNT
jgi:hypothetical protein